MRSANTSNPITRLTDVGVCITRRLKHEQALVEGVDLEDDFGAPAEPIGVPVCQSYLSDESPDSNV